ncbi:MAG TPA: cell division protein FtsH, partial [Gemmatales bacterium]|nr:cell division protein FtsH [Gemmatales bacterium]
HEAGHALCGWLEPQSDPLHKVTIIPRGRALGVTQFRPDDDKLEHTEPQLRAHLVMAMGGRAADKLIFGQTNSGAAMDIKQASRIARLMVTQFGMSEKLGPVHYRIGEEHVFLGKEIQESRDFGESTMQLIDEEVRRLVLEAESRAVEHLTTHRKKLDLLAEALLKREELSKEEVDLLLKAESLDVLPPIVVEDTKTPAAPAKVEETPSSADVPSTIRPLPAV